MKSKKLEIGIPEGKTTVWKNGTLTLIDEPEKSVGKYTRTFEDTYREVGIDAGAWSQDKISSGLEPNVLAFLKLRITVKALNEDWGPQFTEDECCHYPRFILYTREGYNELDEEEKFRVVYWSNNYVSVLGGISYTHAFYDSSFTYAYISVRLVFETSELVAYCSRQFSDIWVDLVSPSGEKSE